LATAAAFIARWRTPEIDSDTKAFKMKKQPSKKMRGEVQQHLKENYHRFEGAQMFNAIEEGFVGTVEEQVEYALRPIADMDSWAGQEFIIAYCEIHELTIDILRPDGTSSTFGADGTRIRLYYSNYVHNEPIIETTAQEKMKLRKKKVAYNDFLQHVDQIMPGHSAQMPNTNRTANGLICVNRDQKRAEQMNSLHKKHRCQ
jgi:hypothetical protein